MESTREGPLPPPLPPPTRAFPRWRHRSPRLGGSQRETFPYTRGCFLLPQSLTFAPTAPSSVTPLHCPSTHTLLTVLTSNGQGKDVR